MAINNQHIEQPTGIVKFNEGPHTYENEEGQRYLSVTQLLDKFKNKFDAQTQVDISINNPKSIYYGRDRQSVLDEWNKSGADARTGGTKFHKKKEDHHIKQSYSIKEKDKAAFVPNPAFIIPMEDQGVMTDYLELPSGTYSELILWSHRWRLAGIADKIIIDGDYFDVEDYKTNKEIKFTSYFKRGEGYQMLKFPLNHIMDCSFYHYELQLSLYAYMFAELSGKKPRNLVILHHPTLPDGSIQQKETRYSVEYRRTDIVMMLKMWGGFAPPTFMPDIQEEKK
jgi:hypothetical protein